MDRLSLWLTVGFIGQGLFMARFVAQWIVSERRGESVVPPIFWRLSLAGSALILAYAVSRNDPVIVAGQSLGFLVYARNLALLGKIKNVNK